jgi:hypothetical protein
MKLGHWWASGHVQYRDSFRGNPVSDAEAEALITKWLATAGDLSLEEEFAMGCLYRLDWDGYRLANPSRRSRRRSNGRPTVEDGRRAG